MKTLGLIGGLSWESTALYYRLLNEGVRKQLGGLHSAQLLMWSFDFAPIVELQTRGNWDHATKLMIDTARRLELGGAEGLVICANTMHKMAITVQEAINIPLIHIADVTATAVKQAGVKNPLLLATRYTMEQDFYKDRLRNEHGIKVVIPGQDDRTKIHDIIYTELNCGIIRDESRHAYQSIIQTHQTQDQADGVILACTEIGLLIKQTDVTIPAFDTTELHAQAAIDFMLQ